MIPRLKPYYNSREVLAALSFFEKDAVSRYEKDFADLIGSKYALAFPYGRSALYTIFKALGISNTEVIIPAYTCIVVANATVLAGNMPRFIDITLPTYNMNLDDLPQKINKNTGAIIATHLFGYPLDTEKLQEIVHQAERRFQRKIYIIQDCAHSFGAEWNGKSVCTEKDIAIFGLNISKIISSIFGGMLTTDDEQLYFKLIEMRNTQMRKPHRLKNLKRLFYLLAVQIAFNRSMYTLVNLLEMNTPFLKSFTDYYKEDTIDLPKDFLDQMLDIEARVGIEQIKKYRQIVERRVQIAQRYHHKLSQNKNLILPPLFEGATFSHYVPLVNDRQMIINRMRKLGVQIGWLIEYSIPELDAYTKWKDGDFPVSYQCSKNTINLPNWPGLNNKDIDTVIRKLEQALST